MGLIFNGNGDVIKAVDGSLTVEGLDFGGISNVNAGIGTFSGNLNVGGVLTYEDVKNVDSVGIVTARAGIKVPDDQRIRLGAANDLDIYHTTSGTSWIRHGNTSEYFVIEGDQMDFRSYTNSHYRVRMGTAVELRHNNTERLKTSSTGVTVTGALNLTGASSGNYLNVGSSTVYANAAINIHRNGSGYADIRLASNYGAKIAFAGASNNTDELYIQQDNTKAAYVWNEANKHITFGTNNTARMWLANNGNFRVVGISTFNSSVHVEGYMYLAQKIVHTGDADTSIEFDTNTIKAETAGSERLRITSGGQVNIGGDYTQTSRFVNINGGSTVGQLQLKGTEADIWLHSTGANGQWRILGSSGNTTHAFRIYDQTNSAERLRITSAGKVVIRSQGATSSD